MNMSSRKFNCHLAKKKALLIEIFPLLLCMDKLRDPRYIILVLMHTWPALLYIFFL